MHIEGKIVLITGASSGIGAALARAAAAAGARVVLIARRADRLTAMAEEIGEAALAIRADVTDAAQVRHAVAAAVSAFGGIDVVVNNAGQAMIGDITNIDIEDYRAIVDLNLVAPMIVMQETLPALRARTESSIINILGVTLMAMPGSSTYSSSKAGLNQLSAVARNELQMDGITVSTIYPFITATELEESMRGVSAAPDDGSGWSPTPHSAQYVADSIIDLIRSGDAELSLLPGEFVR